MKSITIQGYTYIERPDGLLDFDITKRFGTPHGYNTIKKLVNYAKRNNISYKLNDNKNRKESNTKEKSHNVAYFLERMTTGEITDEERIEYNNLLIKQFKENITI